MKNLITCLVVTLFVSAFGFKASAQFNTAFAKEFKALVTATSADIITKDTVSYTNGIVSRKSKLPLSGFRMYYFDSVTGIAVFAHYPQKATDNTVDDLLKAINDAAYTIKDSKTDADAAKSLGSHLQREVTITAANLPKYITKISFEKNGELTIKFTKRDNW